MSEAKAYSGRQIAMMRRKALGNGKNATIQEFDTAPLVETKSTTNSKVVSKRTGGKKAAIKQQAIIQGGRAQSMAYRKASGQGKTAQKSFKNGGSVSTTAKAVRPGASGKEIAKQVRLERCTRGKCATKTSTSKGRVRPAKPSSVNDEGSSTLGGQNISGTRVGKNASITGVERGVCKTVSGIEYLGAEEFTNCSTTPSPKAAKVSTTSTNKGMKVSGTEVGIDEVLTGNTSGKCADITGTEYLPAENQNDFCATKSSAKKSNTFSVMSPASNTNARTDITNSAMNRATQSTTIRSNSAPQKVMPSQTLKGNTTTGTQVGRVAEGVTGSESGACKNVTGSAYVGAEEVQNCDTTITDGANKVLVSGTGQGNVITGDRSGGNDGITGNTGGNCQAVTGTPYVGVENAQSCDTTATQEIASRQKQLGNANLSGTQIAPTGLTGAQKGACSFITGTETYSAELTNTACASSNAAVVGESDYPTPMVASTVAPSQVSQGNASNITGDGWDRGDKVTGTEGMWAANRNSSIRGANLQMPIGAGFRPQDSEVPLSPITGSSGNTDTGAKVTLSGGARA
jgi:hypothetical protein